MKRRTALVYAPPAESEPDAAVRKAEELTGDNVRIAKKNARLCRIVAEHIVTGQQAGGSAKAIVDQLAERLLIEGFNLGIEFAQLRHEAGERP